MRLLTFSFIRNCKSKLLYPSRLHSTESIQTQSINAVDDIKGDLSLIEVSSSWTPEHAELKAATLRDMQVLPDFISEAEESAMLAELEPVLKRMRYEYDHWDDAIHGYRETERTTWQPGNAAVLARVTALAFSGPAAGKPMPHAHVLDLAAGGHIKPHVDAVRFCGNVIAGLCLSSSAVMRLVHEVHKHLQLDALLPRRGLYIMRGVSRYEFSHAVLGGVDSVWRGERLLKGRRVAVILRSKPNTPTP